MTRRVEQLLEHDQRIVEMSIETARDVVRLARDRLSITPASEPGRYLVQTHQYVGALVVPGLEILVRPKIEPENLFLLLGVGLPSRAWLREYFAYDVASHLLPAFAAFFARVLERVLASGLLHAYREERDRLPALRGRIDFAEQIRRPWLDVPVASRFDDFTPDIAENRILKAAIRRLLGTIGVASTTRQTLIRELARFEGVQDEAVGPGDVDRLIFTRLNRHYEPALRLAVIVLRSSTLVDRPGRAAASAFLVDMNDLFQRFLTDRLRRVLRGRLVVEDEPRQWLAVGSTIDMYPDLVFERNGIPVYVADAKYKITSTGRAENPDYYQLLAYTTAMDLTEGVLIYCQVEGNAPTRSIRVRNSGKVLFTYAVDLTRSASEVEASVAALADWIWARSVETERVGVRAS